MFYINKLFSFSLTIKNQITWQLNGGWRVQRNITWKISLLETQLGIFDQGLFADDVGVGAPLDVAGSVDHQAGEDVAPGPVQRTEKLSGHRVERSVDEVDVTSIDGLQGAHQSVHCNVLADDGSLKC